MKKISVICFVIVIVFLTFVFVKKDNYEDTVTYENKVYALLEYNLNIFTYNYNSNDYLEEDIIHPVKHNKWNVVYFNGDLFVLDKQVKDAIKYYSNDDNYEWFIVLNYEDEDVKKSISISDEELEFLYNIESEKEKKTIKFDDINMFADILKVSKDGLVQGIVTLAQIDGLWYYKTEVMTDDDEEYVVVLCDSLNKKINNLL